MSYHKPTSRENKEKTRPELAVSYASECITRPMTPEEKAWMESLPKPEKDESKFTLEGFYRRKKKAGRP
ncbi:hypothetical protein ACTID9_00885 [Brevibacillus fluminis]|uniref:hypothetical protein n=1 Tax=Brevibacillus fluminis TaxID=511487 RepID=UPI003F8C7709